MLPYLASVLFLFVRVQASISNYEPFSPLENDINSQESANRKSLQSNRVIECDMNDIFNIVGLNEIQELIESLAVRKGATPFSILWILQKRMKNKEEMEENIFNAIDRVQVPDFGSPPVLDISIPVRIPPPAKTPPPAKIPPTVRTLPPFRIPPPVRIPPFSNEAIYSLPSQPANTHDDDADVVIIPVAPSQKSSQNRLPPVTKTDFMPKNEEPSIFRNGGSSVSRINQMFSGMFPLPPVKNNQFAATVRVNTNTNDPSNSRDLIITISPRMTIIEALRQAEIKYQNVLGLSHETEIFDFSHSAVLDCYMVNQINGLFNNEEHAWQLTVSDRDNQMVYRNFCLPNGRDVLVKPGMLISLSFVPL